MTRQEKWDLRFLELAKNFSSWSKDPSTKVGCVITHSVNKIVSIGYNGFPEKDPDLPEEYLDRTIKYSKIVHAEINAWSFAHENGYCSLRACTVYTYPFQPCEACAEILVRLNPKRIVSLTLSDEHKARWECSFINAQKLFAKNSIEFKLYHNGFS
jgi:dCMP deaminase